MSDDLNENSLRQLMYAQNSGETEAHIRRAKGYSRKHRRGSDRSYTRHAWKTAWNARLKLKGFTKPDNSFEKIARTNMMGISSSTPWKKYMKRADKARLDPTIPYDFKRAGRDPRFGLTIEGNNSVTKNIKENRSSTYHHNAVYGSPPDEDDIPGEHPTDRKIRLAKKYGTTFKNGEVKHEPTHRLSSPIKESVLKTLKNVVLEASGYQGTRKTGNAANRAARPRRTLPAGTPTGAINRTRHVGTRKVSQSGSKPAGALRSAVKSTGKAVRAAIKSAQERRRTAQARMQLAQKTADFQRAR